MTLPRRFPTDDPVKLKRELEQFSDVIAAALAALAMPALAGQQLVYGDATLAVGAVARMAPAAGTVKANLPPVTAGEQRLIGLAKTVATGTVAITPPGAVLVNGTSVLNKTAAGLYLIWTDGAGYYCTA